MLIKKKQDINLLRNRKILKESKKNGKSERQKINVFKETKKKKISRDKYIEKGESKMGRKRGELCTKK